MANSSKISRGKFISGFALPREKILGRSLYWLPRFSRTVEFWSVNSRRKDVQGSSRSKRRFFLLSRCHFLQQFNVQGEGRRRRRRLVPQKFLSPRELCPVLSSRPSPMSVYWLATSAFHFPQVIALG